MAADRKFEWRDGAFRNRVSGEAIPDDEPVIIFRARDKYALEVLRFYAGMIRDPHHQEAVKDRCDEFFAWRINNFPAVKEPGITRHIRLNSEPDA